MCASGANRLGSVRRRRSPGASVSSTFSTIVPPLATSTPTVAGRRTEALHDERGLDGAGIGGDAPRRQRQDADVVAAPPDGRVADVERAAVGIDGRAGGARRR